MQEIAGTKNATELGGTGSHLIDPTCRRLLGKTLEQERPRHLWFSPRCGPYCTPARAVNNTRTNTHQQTEREKRRRLQQECKGAFELARLQNDVHWDWPDQCAAWNLEFLQEGMREPCLETTTTTGCALRVKHSFFGEIG